LLANLQKAIFKRYCEIVQPAAGADGRWLGALWAISWQAFSCAAYQNHRVFRGHCAAARLCFESRHLNNMSCIFEPKHRDSDQYDFFVSYSRKDNATGWITRFVEELLAEHQKFPRSTGIHG